MEILTEKVRRAYDSGFYRTLKSDGSQRPTYGSIFEKLAYLYGVFHAYGMKPAAFKLPKK